MDTLVALGTGAAGLYSISVVLWPQVLPAMARHLYFEASAMIIGLINLGHALEQHARQHASGALTRLLDLRPPSARVVMDDGEQLMPLAQVALGMTLAAAIEQGSGHPLTHAICARTQEEKDAPAQVQPEQFRTLRGLGVSARLAEQQFLLGNAALLTQQGVNTAAGEAPLRYWAQQGATPVLLAVHDPLRSDSAAALERLRTTGYRLVMLTGDNADTAQTVSAQVGIDQVIAGILPDGKAAAIVSLQRQGYRVR